MASSGSARVGITLWALLAHGCVSGHLLDAARRRELPIRYEEAFVDGDRLLLRYTTLVTDDIGQPIEHRERRAAIALARLRQAPPIDAFPVERLADDAPLPGGRVAIRVDSDDSPGPSLRVWGDARGRQVQFTFDDARDGRYPAVYSSALAHARTPLWVYPLLPLAVAVDVATNPILLLFAPAVILPGD